MLIFIVFAKEINKYHEFTHDHSAILDGNPHPIVYKLKHLAAFGRLEYVRSCLSCINSNTMIENQATKQDALKK